MSFTAAFSIGAGLVSGIFVAVLIILILLAFIGALLK